MRYLLDKTTDPYFNLAAEEYLLKNCGEPVFRLWRDEPSVIAGRKFSGNAIAVHRDRVLQHGTLLFDSSMGDLSAALNTRPEKFADKAVKSNAARVTNIAEHLPQAKKGMTVEEMMTYLMECIAEGGKGMSEYSKTELEAINALRVDRYSTAEWNYGKSPAYTYHNSVKLPCGFIEVWLRVEKGIISDCIIMGDYFFLRPTEDISNALVGVSHSPDAIRQRLSGFSMSDYFGSDITSEIVSLLF